MDRFRDFINVYLAVSITKSVAMTTIPNRADQIGSQPRSSIPALIAFPH